MIYLLTVSFGGHIYRLDYRELIAAHIRAPVPWPLSLRWSET